MFRLQPSHLPEDPKYPADLKELGFFINKLGQFRMIEYPDKDFNYQYSNHERVNEVRREAYQICQRKEVATRLSALGLEKLYLPQLTYTKPEGEAFVPILAPPAEILKTRKRVIVLVNDSLQDLGILAYRRLQRELGVNGGSVINFVKELIKCSTDAIDDFVIFQDGVGVTDKAQETPGFIVMNCGQLLFSHKFSEAKTIRSWNAMPRKSAAHEPIEITKENHVPGNADPKEHIQFVIENVIKNKDFVAEDAEIYVIAIENGVDNLLRVLDEDLNKYGSRTTAMAIMDSKLNASAIEDPHLRAFLHQRAREWRFEAFSNDPRECVDLPRNHNKEVEKLSASSQDKTPIVREPSNSAKLVSWLETAKPQGSISVVGDVLSSITNRLKQLSVFGGTDAAQATTPDISALDEDDMAIKSEPLCPTFADDENPFGAGECVFTSRRVQHAVLEFFEEVARNPLHYYNPALQTTQGLSGNTAYESLPADFGSQEQADINAQKERIERMKAALVDTPAEGYQTGREGLEKRIKRAEEQLENLKKKALATGSLPAGEAKEERRDWHTVGGGPKVPFAGSMVDSELLKAAGMEELVEEELAAALEEEKEVHAAAETAEEVADTAAKIDAGKA